MDKFDMILEKLGEMQLDINTVKSGINTMQKDINTLKKNDEILMNTTASIFESLTEQKQKIAKLEKAI